MKTLTILFLLILNVISNSQDFDKLANEVADKDLNTLDNPPQPGKNVNKFEYISPKPNASLVSPWNNIIIRYGELLNVNSIGNQNLINVSGSISGVHKGDVVLSDDVKTIIFKPVHRFSEGEKVSVKLSKGLKTFDDDDIGELEFDFYVSDSWQNNTLNNDSIILFDEIKSIMPDLEINDGSFIRINKNKIPSEINTPELPNLYVTISNVPSEGYIFITPWFYQGNFLDPNYILIADNYGIPVYYKAISALALDFKIHPDGVMTYHDRSTYLFYAMDSSYNVIDTFACGNGYTTNFHDLQILPDNHYLVMSYDAQTIRMDTIVAGGDPAATVIGLIVQEIDENNNVVFQWRSWDHFLITDASDNINLTGHTIDYVHGNSVEMDNDGNIIISSRHMNEVTKISKTTGDIIWRLGGENNQFRFINDNRVFSYQHDARRLKNNNLTIFDNGNLSSPRYSSSIEYQLDEQNKIATRVWDYSDNNHYTPSMGNSTRLDNGRIFIGWGGSNNPAVTEVTYDGTKTFEMKFDNNVYSYRAFRHLWRTNLITSDRYNVDFGAVNINNAVTEQIMITNNSDQEILISSYFSRSNLFSVLDEFPISLQAFESKPVHIQFLPGSIGIFSDDIYLRIEKANEMIAQVINVSGNSEPSVPVELSSFTAVSEPGKVKLTWSTATETNNLGFEIERASSSAASAPEGTTPLSNKWLLIGFISGKGTTTEPNVYSFVDNVADVTSQSLVYRLKQIDYDGTYNYSDEVLVDNLVPGNFNLTQNYPNPFNPSTTIKYALSSRQFVVLKVYNVLGMEVATLVNEEKPAGSYEVEFSTNGGGNELTSGVYFYRIEAGEFIDTKKIVLMK